MATPILEDILQLSISERIQLVEEIWDTIVDAPEQLPLTDAQRAELDRRMDAHRDDPQAVVPWQDVRNGIKSADGQ
jgi:putative addiction module component (TIGR02574 family)